MRFPRQFLELLVFVCAGGVFGLGLLAWGLYREASDPLLPGTHPMPGLYTVLLDYGAISGPSRRPTFLELEHLQQADPAGQWMFSYARVLPVGRGEQRREARVEFVAGDVFRSLGVPLLGEGLSASAIALPLAATATREVVLSEAFAVRHFGGAEQALGRELWVDTLRAHFMEEGDQLTYRVTGVVRGRYSGMDLDHPAELWIGVNGWFDVLFPGHQIEDLRSRFAAHSLAVQTRDVQRSQASATAALHALGASEARVSLIPGVGFHPERRARFLSLVGSLTVSLLCLGSILVTSLLGLVWLRAERQAEADFVRHALGENDARRRARLLRFGATALGSAVVGVGVLFAIAPTALEGLPAASAGIRALQDPVIWVGALAAASFLVLLPMLMQRPRPDVRASGRTAARRANRMLLALVLFCTALSYVFTVSETRLAEALSPPLPGAVQHAWTVQIEPADGRLNWLADRSSSQVAEDALARVGLALASLPPVGGRVFTVEADIQGYSRVTAPIRVNAVSSNYFAVMGLTELRACSREEIANGSAAWVNREFLRLFAPDLGTASLRVRYRDLFEESELDVCGVVENAYMANARTVPGPLLYRSMRQRRDMQYVLGVGSATPRHRAVIEQTLSGLLRNTRAGQLRTVQTQIETDLAQELAVARISRGLSALALGFAVLATLQLASLALHLQLHELAVRRAVGASRLHLLKQVLTPYMPMAYGVAMTSAALLWLSLDRLLGPAPEHRLIGIAASAAMSALLAGVVGLSLLVRLRERRLQTALRVDG